MRSGQHHRPQHAYKAQHLRNWGASNKKGRQQEPSSQGDGGGRVNKAAGRVCTETASASAGEEGGAEGGAECGREPVNGVEGVGGVQGVYEGEQAGDHRQMSLREGPVSTCAKSGVKGAGDAEQAVDGVGAGVLELGSQLPGWMGVLGPSSEGGADDVLLKDSKPGWVEAQQGPRKRALGEIVSDPGVIVSAPDGTHDALLKSSKPGWLGWLGAEVEGTADAALLGQPAVQRPEAAAAWKAQAAAADTIAWGQVSVGCLSALLVLWLLLVMYKRVNR